MEKSHSSDELGVALITPFKSSNMEAILDLIETYSYVKWGIIKPHAITAAIVS